MKVKIVKLLNSYIAKSIHQFNDPMGGTIGRVPDSAQFYNRVLATLRTLTRMSTGGKENRDRTHGKSTLSTGWRAGQALVILLVFVATATIITSAAVTVTIINARSTGILAQGIEALAVAEAGAEEAILRILRDPLNNYAGATIPVGNGTATIVVAGTTTKTITSTGTIGTFTRKIQVQGTFSDDKFTLSSWQEIN